MCMMQLMSRWSLVLTLALLTLALACGRADNGVPEPGTPAVEPTPGVEPTEEALEPAQTATTNPSPAGELGECEPVAYEKPKYANDDRLWKKADPEKKKLLEVKAKYSDYLFSFPGVFGVGVGLVRKDGQLTHDRAILVMVDINRPPEH